METTAAQQSEPRHPATPGEWASWLGAEEERTLRKYTDYPELLIADGQHERQIAGDYVGREILELLQNANDAAADDRMRGRVSIEVLPIGLLIANEGAAFTTDGVASLKLANLSPKRSRQRQTIGNKGLGFRAVLNWTRTPIVLSGGLQWVACLGIGEHVGGMRLVHEQPFPRAQFDRFDLALKFHFANRARAEDDTESFKCLHLAWASSISLAEKSYERLQEYDFILHCIRFRCGLVFTDAADDFVTLDALNAKYLLYPRRRRPFRQCRNIDARD